MSKVLVPANCEMIIEGVVPLDEPLLPEGPFGEMYGYLGRKKDENFWMNVTAVTYRKDPWLMNQFTGVTRGYVTAPVSSLFNDSASASSALSNDNRAKFAVSIKSAINSRFC